MQGTDEEESMSYHISRETNLSFHDAVESTKASLSRHGFGVLTEIDVKDTLKKKLDVDFRPYRIFGACNPNMAYKALQNEDKIGTMLPCNVVVQEREDGKVEVSAVDPSASMQAIHNDQLAAIANQVRTMLEQVIEEIE
jgi:uncharacterized protein (DUF302 family)